MGRAGRAGPALLLVSLDAEVLNLAAPQLAAALRPSNVQLLWIMDSYVFVLSGTLIGAGVLGDRVGRRRLLLAGSAAFAVASLLAAFATTPDAADRRPRPDGTGRRVADAVDAGPDPGHVPRPAGARGAAGVWSAGFSLGGVGAPLIGGCPARTLLVGLGLRDLRPGGRGAADPRARFCCPSPGTRRRPASTGRARS